MAASCRAVYLRAGRSRQRLRQVHDRLAASLNVVEHRADLERIGRVEVDERGGDFLGHIELVELRKTCGQATAGGKERAIRRLRVQQRLWHAGAAQRLQTELIAGAKMAPGQCEIVVRRERELTQ